MRKKIIKLLSYIIFPRCLFPKHETKSKDIVIIKTDGIGDYILFRNYLKIIRDSRKFSGYKITLVGNILWKDLSEFFDKNFIDDFIWIDKNKYVKNLIYRYKIISKINSKSYALLLNPTYSREIMISENIVRLVHASQKIGFFGDVSNITLFQREITSKNYTNLIYQEDDIKFEFDRNYNFFEKVLFDETFEVRLEVQQTKQKKPYKLVVFIGGAARFRRWNTRNYAILTRNLKQNFGYEVVLCGTSNEIQEADDFIKEADFEYENLVGKTSLIDMVNIISECGILLTNDSGFSHLAIALKLDLVVVISNGNHYKRFVPYPTYISKDNYIAFFPKAIKIDDVELNCDLYGTGSDLDINDVDVNEVIEVVHGRLRHGGFEYGVQQK